MTMKTRKSSIFKSMGVSIILGIAVFLFWGWAYPHALSYQEQYQLFLWTGDYLHDALLFPGGFAAWLGEMVVQFYVFPWLGAFLLSLLFVALQRVVVAAMSEKHGSAWQLLGLLPPIMVLTLMGDESVLLSYLVALISSIAIFVAFRRKPLWADVIVVPLAYWLLGPLAWLYVLLRMVENGWLWFDGYRGICRLMNDIKEACLEKKPMRELVQIKGWGCSCG